MTFALLAVTTQLACGQFLVFGEGKSWLILNDVGEVHRAISAFPAGIPSDVREVAVNAEGSRIAVTAMLPSAQNVMLFLWDVDSGAVSQIGDSVGFHAAPTFSKDGRHLIFAHHPKKGGPPGAHEAGSFAQLYQQDLQTLELKALTNSRGCHMSSAERNGRIYFAHANCVGGRRLELLEAGKERPLTEFDEHHGEPSLSRNGEALLFTRGR